MDELLRAWETTFGCSTLPFGVAEVLLDDRGRPYDFAYRYINAAAAALTGHVAEDLLGEEAYALWGGDPIWLDHFYEAAYEGRASEFEAPSEMLQQFFRAEVFPISEGLCGFTIHDVTDWILPAQRSMEKAAAGLFFYDMRYRQMLLTEQAREQSGVDSNYISLTEFIDLTFGSTLSEEVRQKMKAFLERREAFYQEGRLPNGRWLRMSLDHTDRSERFAFGFLEDFTRTKLAEERSEQYIDIIDSLGAENFALYLVDLETQELEVYRRGEEMTAEFALASAEEGDYPAAMERYIDTFVVAEDRSRVRAEIGAEALWRRLEAGETDFSVGYRRLFGDEEQYVELRIIRLPQRDSKVILAARNVTGEMREQLRQKVALQNALDLAEHASQAKSTFLTNMSHDFRTPMNSISGFASIALDHLNDTDRVRDCLRKIMLSSDHLLSLVNDILDVSRIESGKMSFNEDIVSLPDAVIEVQGMFGEKAAASGVDLTIDVDNVAHPQVVTDPLRLNQILVNTVGNAVKFTPSGGARHRGAHRACRRAPRLRRLSLDRERHRLRHDAGVPRSHLSALRARWPRVRQQDRGHGAGHDHHQEPRRPYGRRDSGGKRRGPRLDVRHHAAAARGRRRRAGRGPREGGGGRAVPARFYRLQGARGGRRRSVPRDSGGDSEGLRL